MAKVNSFAERLIALREERGMTKSGLSRAVGVTTTCVWNWEEGNTHPRADTLARLARALATTAAYLERGVIPAGANYTAPQPIAASSTMAAATGPSVITSAPPTVAEVIMRARNDIAEAAGLRLDQVKVVLQYGGEQHARAGE